MRIKLSTKIQIGLWFVYWLQLLIINLFYFDSNNYTKPLLVLWSILYTCCGIVVFYFLTRIYNYLAARGGKKSITLFISAVLCFIAAYIWSLFEPILSWIINPNIKNLIIYWDINSRNVFAITFIFAFFSLVHFYNKMQDEKANKEAEKTESTENPEAVSFYWKNEIVTLQYKNIKKISVEGNYSIIIDDLNNKYELKRSLKKWETGLSDKEFKRIHRSVIINSSFIEKIETWDNYTLRVKLAGIDKPEEVSRRYSAILKKQMHL